MNAKCPPELQRQYRAGRVIPFVGAGVSMAVSWTNAQGEQQRGPSWRELVDEAARLLGFEEAELARARGTDLQILEYFKRQHDGAAKLTNWLAKLMDPPAEVLGRSPLHSALVSLDRSHLFYTTNYDNFLERAFELAGRAHRVVAVEAEMGTGPDAACEIVKFHGDLDHPNEIVLSESDYERRLSLAAPLDLRLQSDLLGRVVLFLGYSFRDPNVSYLFRLFMDHATQRVGPLIGTRAYIVVPDPSDFEYKLFQARGIEVIGARGQCQTDDIVALLRALRG